MPDNNAAERGMRSIAVGRKNWLFAGSEAGGRAAAAAYTLIETAKLNKIGAQVWLTDVLGRIAEHKLIASTSFCLGTIISRQRPKGAHVTAWQGPPRED